MTEAYDPQQELFGEDRLLEQLAQNPGQNATATVASVLDAVRAHAAGSPQSDDTTIVAVRYTGNT